MERRNFLLGAAAGTVALGLGACSSDETNLTEATDSTAAPPTVAPFDRTPFTLGVASGDPDSGSVVLWTRLALEPLAGGGMQGDVPVQWEVATDDSFDDIVASGTEPAIPRYGHSVHVIADGLEPATRYRYRFQAGAQTSAVGMTRTAPADDAPPDTWKLGVASCQDYQDGFYNAWRDVAATDLDLMIFLGDYIYEYGPAPLGPTVNRQHNSDEITDLVGYRNRYALYKGDPLLQAAHARCPWVVVWDDHEVENNYADSTPEDPGETAGFEERRAAAYQAWWEHQPVRFGPPADGELTIYRALRWGTLANLIMLDTRQYRTDQACGDQVLQLTTPACAEVTAPGRTLLGTEQETWLFEQLDGSDTAWNVIGNQVVMTDLRVGPVVLNFDQWDGYPEARQRLLGHLDSEGITNCVVLTGDIHLGGVGDLNLETASGAKTVATEFVGTSISSGGLIPESLEDTARSLLTDVKYFNARQRGWLRCEVTATEWTAEYRVVQDNHIDGSPLMADGTFTVTPDRPGAVVS